MNEPQNQSTLRMGVRILFADAVVVARPSPIERIRVSDLPMASSARSKPVTEKQVKRLFGISRGSHWSRPQVVELLHLWFKKADPLQLTRAEYDKICNFILVTPGPAESIETLFERRKAS